MRCRMFFNVLESTLLSQWSDIACNSTLLHTFSAISTDELNREFVGEFATTGGHTNERVDLCSSLPAALWTLIFFLLVFGSFFLTESFGLEGTSWSSSPLLLLPDHPEQADWDCGCVGFQYHHSWRWLSFLGKPVLNLATLTVKGGFVSSDGPAHFRLCPVPLVITGHLWRESRSLSLLPLITYLDK